MNRYTSVFEQSLMLEADGEYVLYKDARQAIATARATAKAEALREAKIDWSQAIAANLKIWFSELEKESDLKYRIRKVMDNIAILADKQEGKNAI